MKKIIALLIVSLSIFLIACSALSGKEIASTSIEKISNIDNPSGQVITLDLNAGDKIWFWTDMDLSYNDELALEYQIQLIKNADTLGFIRFYPFQKKVTIGEVKTTFGGKTNWSFLGRMDFLQINESAKYTFRILLASNENETLVLNKARLILKK